MLSQDCFHYAGVGEKKFINETYFPTGIHDYWIVSPRIWGNNQGKMHTAFEIFPQNSAQLYISKSVAVYFV